MGEDTKYCGNCKREVSAINYMVHTVHCQRNIAVCSLCGEAVPRARYHQHVDNNHKTVPCSRCGTSIQPFQLFAHEKDACPRRMVACEHCELEVASCDLTRHVEYCEARTERCKGCSKFVQFRHLQFHYENDHKYLKPEDKERADENGSDEEESEECPICLGPVTLPVVLECNHTFCMVCVKGIANTTKNCAICRRDIARDMLMDIRFCREEDIIKNYVNKPRDKKTMRSHSVPGRSYSGTPTPARRLTHHTTQDYDDMVSALMSSRTSSASYRYDRPSNTHTPPSYTPYSSTTTSSSDSWKDSCKDSCKDTEDDDCCCSSSANASSSSSSSSTATSTTTVSSTRMTTASTTATSKTSNTSASQASTGFSSTRSSTTTTTSYSGSSTRSSSVPSTPYRNSLPATQMSTTTSTSISTSSSTCKSTASLATTSASSPTVSSSSVSSSTVAASSSSSSSTTSSSSSTASSSTTTYSSTYSDGVRPKRPTSLAIETFNVVSALTASVSSSSGSNSATGSSRSAAARSLEPPENATQEEYDRWLAFQLAKADDDLPPSEFNRKHRPTFRRSFSMPERAGHPSESSSSDSDSDTPSSRGSSRRPPASPRNAASSSSSASSSSRSTPISKSSSDSNASSSGSSGNSNSSSSNSSSSALSTGARPKMSGLKKRVSFKEDAPPLRREAPVMLPCEFCDEVFPERDLMRHQTSCEQNETQLPRTSRLAQRAAAAAAAASGTSISTAVSSVSSTSATTTRRTSVSSTSSSVNQSSSDQLKSVGPSSPPPRRRAGRTPTPVCTPPRKAPVPAKPDMTTNRKATAYTSTRATVASTSRRSPTPASPTGMRNHESGEIRSPPPMYPSSTSPPPMSPPPTTTITIVDKPPAVVVSPSLNSGCNRPFSVSPGPSSSTSNCSSSPGPGGSISNSSVSSGSMSSSVSTTPSTSSSASPVPVTPHNHDLAPPDTPTTDAEYDFEDEDAPFSRPRRGRLLSSAIFSWRSISATGAASRKGYERSNTAPLEDTGIEEEAKQIQPVTTSRSATQLPGRHSSDSGIASPLPHATDTLKEPSDPPQTEQTSPVPSQTAPAQEHAETIFIKNPNKYKAPPPPPPPPTPPHYSSPKKCNSPFLRSPEPQISNQTRSLTPQKLITNTPVPQEKTQMNGIIKFDSKPMMNGNASKDIEGLIPCEFCKKIFSPEKFQSHQTMCEAALQPPTLRPTSPPLEQSAPQKSKSPIPARHKKGPAPPPPPENADIDTNRSPSLKRMERSQSVKDDRSSFNQGVRVTRRLERASSIKESRSSYYAESPNLGRRWGSREVLQSSNLESSSAYSSGSGVWSGSTNNLLGGYTGGHGWSSHVSMVRDDVRSSRAAATAAAASSSSSANYDGGAGLEVDNGVEGEGGDTDSRGRPPHNASKSTFLVEVRAALNKTNHPHLDAAGGARYRERSSSRPRPSSMYSNSVTWGSMFDLSSPTRQFNIADAFSSASASLANKRRYLR